MGFLLRVNSALRSEGWGTEDEHSSHTTQPSSPTGNQKAGSVHTPGLSNEVGS